jgi:hypothetical protein
VVVNGTFFDVQTLRPLAIKTPNGSPGGRSPVSGDGTVFGAWNTMLSPGSSTTFVLQGDELRRHDDGTFGHIVPGPDGRFVFSASGPMTAQLQFAKPKDRGLGYSLPSVQGPYFFTLTSANSRGLALYLVGHEQPLVKDDQFNHGLRFDGWDREQFGAWKRFFFIPQAKVIVILPPSNDQLILHRFDVDQALENSGVDYLLVTSQPPVTAKRGTEFSYQMVVKAKKGGVKYQLDSGPAGMEMSPAGQVRWSVPATFKEAEATVVISVRDAAGQEIFHTFTLKIPKD